MFAFCQGFSGAADCKDIRSPSAAKLAGAFLLNGCHLNAFFSALLTTADCYQMVVSVGISSRNQLTCRFANHMINSEVRSSGGESMIEGRWSCHPKTTPAIKSEMTLFTAFGAGKWEFTKRALREDLDGLLESTVKTPFRRGNVGLHSRLLESGFLLSRVELHDPPGGDAYELRNVDGRGLYIKLKLVWPYVIVMSFHY